MQITRTMLLAGAAAMTVAGFAGMAKADPPATHILSVRLPDGQVERIEYTGQVPPAIIVAPPMMSGFYAPASIGPDAPAPDPFGMLDRLAATMDQQVASMFREVNALAALPGLEQTGPGIVQAFAGPGVCMQSVQITYSGNGQAPHVVSHTSGNCGAAGGHATPATMPDMPTFKHAPAPNQVPGVVEAKAAYPYPDLVHTVSDQPR